MTTAPLSKHLHRQRASRARPAWARWMASWMARLLITLLLVQLFALTQHDHPVSAKTQHCVACALHAQPQAGPPPALPAPAPFSWTLLHAACLLPCLSTPSCAAAWLLLPARAPPVFLPIA